MEKLDLYDSNGLPRAGMELFYSGMQLMEEIVSMGYSAYIVGGCVRDIIMGKNPHDIDIATNMPIGVIKKHYKTIEYGGGERHGTVIVRYGNDDFELTQFRSESTYSDNRRPDEVKFVNTFEEDTLRRDFTINAMGIGCDGQIIDYHGGLKDIKNKIIRTVGNPDERFSEDSLRILRAARFAAKMGFTIDDTTQLSMSKLADTITNVSDERVRDEFEKSMSSPYSFGIFIRILFSLKIIQKIFPSFNEKNIQAICRAVTSERVINFALMFPTLYEIKELQKFKLSNSDMKVIGYCINSIDIYSKLDDKSMLLEEKVNIVIDDNFYYLIKFHEALYRTTMDADLISHYRELANLYSLNKDVNVYISSKGMTGSDFGKVVSGYKKWGFNYVNTHGVLPIELEWKGFIDRYVEDVKNFIALGKLGKR